MTKQQYSAGTFLTLRILHAVHPGGAAREEPCPAPPGDAAAVQRCPALPHNRSDPDHGADLLQPASRRAAQPSKPLAGSSSHVKVTKGRRPWLGVMSNFQHAKRHIEIR